ncbi:MAG: alpha/beta hydrolase [Bacteroidota bacterium]
MKSIYTQAIVLLFMASTTYAAKIDTAVTVSIGGIQQVISMRGKQADQPALLYLHGGPGQAASSQQEKITSQLESSFVVIHWDQRNAGKTLTLNTSPQPATLAQMQHDAEEVLDYIRQTLQQEKVVIVAHSWGNVLGFHLASKYPGKIAAFVSVSPGIYPTKSQKIALKRLKKYFRQEHHAQAIAQLDSIKVPHRGLEDMIIQYRWQHVYEGEEVTDEMLAQYRPFFTDWEKKWMPIYQSLYDQNLLKQIKEIRCPVYFFVGNRDYTSNYNLTAAYYKRLKAPQKEIIWFDTGHNIPHLVPDLFQQQILKVLDRA